MATSPKKKKEYKDYHGNQTNHGNFGQGQGHLNKNNIGHHWPPANNHTHTKRTTMATNHGQGDKAGHLNKNYTRTA